jgi:uncharacterized protein GlcG (DUF336 family)
MNTGKGLATIWSGAFGLALFLAAGAEAQPAGGPAAPPRRLAPYGTPITLEQARQVMDAAQAEARRRNVEATIAIVEPTGELVMYEKATGAQYAAYDFAMGKARAAARYRRESKAFADQVHGGDMAALTFVGAMAAAGGVPILSQGRIIGAIGETGGADEEVATAGANALK